MSTGFQTEIEAAQLSPCWLVKADFTSGTVALWSGIGEITHEGQVYTGAGKLMGISSIKETQNLEAVGVSVTLSGLPSDLISIALNENYRGRSVIIYMGAISTTGVLYTIQLFGGTMDVMELSTDGQTASISVQCESDLIRLREPVNKFYTPEDQKVNYPTDKGFDFVPALQDKEITWGQGVQ